MESALVEISGNSLGPLQLVVESALVEISGNFVGPFTAGCGECISRDFWEFPGTLYSWLWRVH